MTKPRTMQFAVVMLSPLSPPAPLALRIASRSEPEAGDALLPLSAVVVTVKMLTRAVGASRERSVAPTVVKILARAVSRAPVLHALVESVSDGGLGFES